MIHMTLGNYHTKIKNHSEYYQPPHMEQTAKTSCYVSCQLTHDFATADIASMVFVCATKASE